MFSSISTPSTPRPRQQAGLACEECRRRKLRCDRQQPSCGVCRESGVVCTRTTTRQPRGPKKGHLRALQSRIVALERRLNSPNAEERPEDDVPPCPFPDEVEPQPQSTPAEPSFDDFCWQDALDAVQVDSTGSGSSTSSLWAQELPVLSPGSGTGGGSSNSSTEELATLSHFMSTASPIACLTDLMRADLDQLYFDRAHDFCPLLHRRRYFSRAGKRRSPQEANAFSCLQHAMWTLASSMSSQFQNVQEELYAYTRTMLDNLEIDPLQVDSIPIEQVQAWTLLSVYEFMRAGYRRAWMSAGKCFRLAVLMKLHNIDGRDGIATQSVLGFAEIEERRRTFWMAYTIDRFISLLDHLPLTFDQHVILTRLPAPEHEFQSDIPVTMAFLSESQQDDPSTPTSSFTESIRLVTLCGQSLSHQQQAIAEYAGGFFSLDFWTRHRQLDAQLTQSVESMSQHDPCAVAYLDPMPLFTHMAAQVAILMLYQATQSSPWGLDDYQETAQRHEQRALAAARQVVSLSKMLNQLSYFKIHPFTPVLLYLCGDFVRSNLNIDPTFEMQIALQNALQSMSSVNRMAADCLNRLKLGVSPGS